MITLTKIGLRKRFSLLGGKAVPLHRLRIVLFGAMTKALDLDGIDWEEIIRETVPEKTLDLNLAAYRAGRDAAM